MSERAREIAHAEYLADPTHTHVDYPKMRCRACRDRDCLAETIQSALEEATAGVEKERDHFKHVLERHGYATDPHEADLQLMADDEARKQRAETAESALARMRESLEKCEKAIARQIEGNLDAYDEMSDALDGARAALATCTCDDSDKPCPECTPED